MDQSPIELLVPNKFDQGLDHADEALSARNRGASTPGWIATRLFKQEMTKGMLPSGRWIHQGLGHGLELLVDDGLGLTWCAKPFGIERLSAECAVEAFVITVLPR